MQASAAFAVDGALFYNRYHDITSTLPGPVQPGPAGTFTLPLTLVNGLDAETYGAEVAASWQATRRWRLYAAYTFLEMHLRRKETGLPTSAEDAEGQNPEHQIYIQSSWDLPGEVEFDLMGRYVDRITGLVPGDAPVADTTIDAYIALDARLAKKLRRNLTVEVVGRNLLDSGHREFGTNPFFRSEPAEIERSVYGRITWQF